MRILAAIVIMQSLSVMSSDFGVNPCCSYPCENGGICIDHADYTFTCDCTNTGYTGVTCKRANWWTWIKNAFRPSHEFLHNVVSNNKLFWKLLNRVYILRSFFMKVVLIARTGIIDAPPTLVGLSSYPTIDVGRNFSYHARTLPPVPLGCPTPMGTKGPTELPDPKIVVEKLFERKMFIPNFLKSNVLFATYAQHFTHMFFKTDLARGPAYTWGDHNVLMSHIYGQSAEIENKLRQFVKGRMKTQIIKGEEYPPLSNDIDLLVSNPKNVSISFGLGHPFFNMLPSLAFLSTIFIREHNRVAGILALENTHWDDEKLFQITKNILLAETIKITVEDYVQHLSNYHFKLLFDPTIMHHERLQYQNRIHYEFNLLYHWHPLMPDKISIEETDYTMTDWMFNVSALVNHGSKAFAKGLISTRAGQIAPHNHGKYTLGVVENLLKHSRTMRLQPFNEYRKRFLLKPYLSFRELTNGNIELAEILKDLYHDIDALELYPGLICEHVLPKGMFGSTMIEMGSPYSLQGLYGNIFSSPSMWKPSTFGGSTGFKIATTATLKQLMCRNMPPPCIRISFKTEGENDDAVDSEPAKHLLMDSTQLHNNLNIKDPNSATSDHHVPKGHSEL